MTTNFEYAAPQTEAEAVDLLNDHPGDTALLAGGTDLMTLLRRDLVRPRRVVNLKTIPTLREIRPEAGGVLVGTLATLEDLADSPLLDRYESLRDVVRETRAIQIQQTGTIGGDLCHFPNCWYFRNGHGLLALQDGRSLVADGDNRYHAILGNSGPAKFVSASRLAPPLIAWGAKVRIVGPRPDQVELLPLEQFHITPKTDRHGVTILKPGQFVSHVWLPDAGPLRSASYEVLEVNGLDWPLAAASACLEVEGGTVRQARIVLGHVAPVPWVAHAASRMLLGQAVTDETATAAAEAALSSATPLSMNDYKVQIARACVARAIRRAAQREGGL